VAPNLIESELFGHVKGAFTGATTDREGAFESADGGTLFLDEIGELPLELQPKLLRALQSREVRRVGGSKTRRVNVRIVAATNRSLQAEMEAGRFREDLYYRLAVVRVPVPPLRNRLDDIPLLVAHFERQIATTEPGRKVTEAMIRQFQNQRWPGNLRELRNAVENAVTLGGTLRPDPVTSPEGAEVVQPAKPGDVNFAVPLRDALEHLERTYLVAALKATDGNLTRAAELIGINRKFVQRAVKRYQLRAELV
jgi:transcriptional regulator with GAF, ATPase, and Fis domain